MAIHNQRIIVGNIGKIYDLRTVGRDNREVLDFSVALTARKKVGENQWEDAPTEWLSCTAWGKLAANISASFKSGDRVILIARQEMKDGYTNKEGQQVEARPICVVEYAGLEVSYHSASSDRVSGGGNGGGSAQRSSAPRQAAKPAPAAAPEEDIFASDDAFGGGGDDDLPF